MESSPREAAETQEEFQDSNYAQIQKSEEIARIKRQKREEQRRMIELEEATERAREENMLNRRLIRSQTVSQNPPKPRKKSPISELLAKQDPKESESIQMFKENVQSPQVTSIEINANEENFTYSDQEAPEDDPLSQEIKGQKFKERKTKIDNLAQRVGAKLKEKKIKKLPSQNSNMVGSEQLVKELKNVQRNPTRNEIRDQLKSFNDLETNFSQNLARIYDKGAHKSGVTACHRLIDEYCGQPEVVSIFLKALSNKGSLTVAKAQSANSFLFLQFHASLFGYLALKFGPNMKDLSKDIPPSLIKTVRRVVSNMKDLFFKETHENIRNACAISLAEILENCFTEKRYGKEREKLAKDLIYLPLYEELQQGKDRASRQSACYIIRKLNERYMDRKDKDGRKNQYYDPDIVDLPHALNLTELGIKNKLCDADFLGCLSDMMDIFGPTYVLGKHLIKAIPHFIYCIKYNIGGTNAVGKVHRDKNIEETLKLLTIIPTKIIGLEYAKQVGDNFTEDVYKNLELLKGENNKINKMKQNCLTAWKKLEMHNNQQNADIMQTSSSPQFRGTQKFDNIVQSRPKSQARPGSAAILKRTVQTLADRRKDLKDMKYARKQEMKRSESNFRSTQEDQLNQLKQIQESLVKRPQTGDAIKNGTPGSLKNQAIKANNLRNKMFETDNEQSMQRKPLAVSRENTNSPPRDRKQMEENYLNRQGFINRPHQYDKNKMSFKQNADLEHVVEAPEKPKKLTKTNRTEPKNLTKTTRSTSSTQNPNTSPYQIAALKSMGKSQSSGKPQVDINFPQLTSLQQHLDKSLLTFQEQMKEIEQKIQQTQQNMENMQNKHEKNRQKTREQINSQQINENEKDSTMQMLMVMIQKQQEQINQFMQGTHTEVSKMKEAIEDQGKIQEDVKQNIEKNQLDPTNPEIVEQIAQAIYELQQNDKIQEEIKKIGEEIDQNQVKMKEIKENQETVKKHLNEFSQPPEKQFTNEVFEFDSPPPKEIPLVQVVRNTIEQQCPVLAHLRTLSQKHPDQLSFMDKKLLKQHKMAGVWLRISQLAFEQDFQGAYDLALKGSDDIYLLRLVLQTGPVLNHLSFSTAKTLLFRLNKINRSGTLPLLETNWLEDGRDLIRTLSRPEQNEYLDTLYQISQSHLGDSNRANEVFGYLKKICK